MDDRALWRPEREKWMTERRLRSVEREMDAPVSLVPPHAVDAERAVLSGILLSGGNMALLGDLLAPRDFYLEAHRQVFGGCVALQGECQPIDAVTMANYLRTNDLYERVGGGIFLAGLLDDERPVVGNIMAYARIVKEKSVVRGVIEAARAVIDLAHDSMPSTDQFLDDSERVFIDATRARIQPGAITPA